MKKILLTQGKFALVDDEDFETLNQFKWYYHNMGYACRRGGRVLLHRSIINPPEGFEIDHINGDGLDNRRQNLRVVTHKQNIYNSTVQRNSKSKVKGVRFFGWSKRQKPWQAYICPNNKFKSLGYYKTIEEAALTYKMAAERLYGEYAKY